MAQMSKEYQWVLNTKFKKFKQIIKYLFRPQIYTLYPTMIRCIHICIQINAIN